MTEVIFSAPDLATIYELIQQEGKTAFWSSDGGTTPAPDWVANVGVIA